jgi:hypothetical protein
MQCVVCEQEMDRRKVSYLGYTVCGSDSCMKHVERIEKGFVAPMLKSKKTLFEKMAEDCPAMAAVYEEAYANKTITLATFTDLIREFMASPPAQRLEAEMTIRELSKRPDSPPCTSGIALEMWQEETEAIAARLMAEHKKLSAPFYLSMPCERCGTARTSAGKDEADALRLIGDTCSQCRYVHGKGRRPAFDDDRIAQCKAVPGTTYRRLQDPARDIVLIIAISDDDRRVRMAPMDGKLWHMLSGKTNAPQGEVAITDDDLETFLQLEKAPEYTLQTRPRTGQIQDKLTRQLFMTDPEICAYVAKQAEVSLVAATLSMELRERLDRFMERAWTMAFERDEWGKWAHPREHAWAERCHSRACSMMRHDPDLR